MSIIRDYFLFIFIIFSGIVYGDNIFYKAKKNLNYKEKITRQVVAKHKSKIPNNCKSFDIDEFNDNYVFVASHYIARNKLICKKDIIKIKLEYISFNFGKISIRREGRIISENSQYIKIKTITGKTYKIYKNGKY